MLLNHMKYNRSLIKGDENFGRIKEVNYIFKIQPLLDKRGRERSKRYQLMLHGICLNTTAPR